MTDSNFDVVIVGAGPAGLYAAEILAAQGVEVAVIEKDRIPGKNKPCGGFLTLKGVTEGKIPQNIIERSTTGISISMPGRPIRHVDYPSAVGIQLTREALGRHLCKQVENAGAKVFLQQQVIRCEREDSRWRIRLKGSTTEFYAPLLIGADGVTSVVARETGLRTRFLNDQLGITIQARIRLSEEEISKRFGTRMEVYYGRDICPFGYLWIFPKRKSVYVGVGSLLSTFTGRLQDYLHNFIINHPHGKKQLAGGKIQLVERALVPLTYERKSVADGVLLVGDAAGHCSAITGEGIHYAISAGIIAGKIVGAAIKKGDISHRFLRRYEKQWDRAFGSDLKWGLRLRNYFFRGMASQNMSSGMASNENFFKLAADLIVGLRPYRNIIIQALPYYGWQRLKSAFSRN